LKLCNIVDEHTREALAMRVGRRCDADELTAILDVLRAERGAPGHLRMDNGPELIAWALRDWCRLAGTNTSYIEPGSPWENPYIESFNGRVRDELLNIEEFGSLREAQVLVEAWRIEYNTYRPHSALGGLTPAAYRHHQVSNDQPAPS
jgi:putative transposase